MDNKQNSEGQGKSEAGRKIVTTLLVLLLLVGLALAARYLVGSLDIVEMLKKLHGG